MSRFVSPQTRTLTISKPPGQDHPDTLVVRRRLTAGEERAMFARMYVMSADGTMHTDPLAVQRSTILAYLLDWSVIDDEGEKVAIAGLSADELAVVLDGLDPLSFQEIHAAIEAHQIQQAKERAAEKNGQGGEHSLPAISPSPAAATGATSGSSNSIPT